jgi:hypothetical protein
VFSRRTGRSDESRDKRRHDDPLRFGHPHAHGAEPPPPHGKRPHRHHPGPSLHGQPLEAFDLFCALLLGIMPDNTYRQQSPQDVARRYGLSVAQLYDKLQEFRLDPETLQKVGFDLKLARYDIKVAPAGISRRELAKPWFEEYQEAVTTILGPKPTPAAEPTEPVEPTPAPLPPTAAELKSPIFED